MNIGIVRVFHASIASTHIVPVIALSLLPMLRKLVSVLPAAILAATSLAAVAAMKLAPGQPGEPVAALFMPGVGADGAFRRVLAAGGEVLRPGGLPSVLIARSADPDFAAALYRMGAVLVANANGARGCPDPTSGDTR